MKTSTAISPTHRRASRSSRRSGLLGAAVLVAGALAFVGGSPSGAQETTQATATAAALAESASCAQGDIDISYEATNMQRTTAQFTDEAGTVLDEYDEVPFTSDHTGTEHILLDADPAPAAGTVVGVYVTVGAQEPSAATTAEFFVAWRCDSVGNDEGGDNEALLTCFGPYGNAPRTVAEAEPLLAMDDPPADCVIDPAPTTTTSTTTTTAPVDPGTATPGVAPTPASPVTPVSARPAYTG